MRIPLILLWTVLFLALACSGPERSPRPYGYHRIALPQKAYQEFDAPGYPYRFEYPVYGKIVPDTSRQSGAYWVDLRFPEYNGAVHISYKAIDQNLTAYTEDARDMAYKHAVRADAIQEQLIRLPRHNVYGTFYEIGGDAASALQFYITDSSRHFLRGALYFRAQADRDSLGPVIRFFRQDIYHLIETTAWKN